MIIIDDDGIMHKVLSMDVLDEIRAEITQMTKNEGSDYQLGMNYGLMKAVQVIDRHIGEGSKE